MNKLIVLSAVAMLSACAIMPSNHGTAFLGNTKESVMATNTTGSKTGKACGMNFLGIFTEGDSSIAAAKKAGRISTVSSIDREIERYLVVGKTCTVVTGQ